MDFSKLKSDIDKLRHDSVTPDLHEIRQFFENQKKKIDIDFDEDQICRPVLHFFYSAGNGNLKKSIKLKRKSKLKYYT